MSRWRSPLLDGLLAAALFGASTPASKLLLGSIDPFLLAGLLYLGAAAGTAPWAWRGRRSALRADRRNGLLLGGSVVLGGGLGPVLLLSGLRLAPSASVALWLTLESVATTLLAWAFFREHVHGRTWLASGLIFAGSVLLAAPGGFALGSAGALVVLACLCWGVDNCLTAAIDRFTPAQTTFVKGIAAGAFNVVLGVALGGRPSGTVMVLALAMGALCYGGSLVLYISAAQRLGALRSQMVFATAPAWGVLLSWTLLSERVAPVQLIAAVAIASAIWLMHTERHAHPHAHGALRHTHRHRHDDGHHQHEHAGLPPSGWHSHEHEHPPLTHAHEHWPDLHHRHGHG